MRSFLAVSVRRFLDALPLFGRPPFSPSSGKCDGSVGLLLALGPPTPLLLIRTETYSGRISTRPTWPISPPVLHGGEIRACGDFKYGLINICAADFTPIALPTWGHIGQIASDLPNHPRVWPFMKAAHRSANKNLPPNPDQSEFCIAAHRPLGDSNWHGFACRALLFGAAAAVRRYNSPSRAAAVIINRLFGLPPSHLF